MPAMCSQSPSRKAAAPRHGRGCTLASSLLVVNDYRLVTSRSMSGVLNFCEAETHLCRLLPQMKCLTLTSRPRNYVRIARETGRDV